LAENNGLIQRILSWFQRAFASETEDPRRQATDTGLQIHTSPELWPYEMYVLEYDRRIIISDIHRILQADPRTWRALNKMAAGAVRGGITIKVMPQPGTPDSVAVKAQDVLDQLRKDTRIDAKLPSWSRMLLAEGDLFLEVVAVQDGQLFRIVNLKRIPAITMHRNDDMQGNFPDIQAAFTQIDPISLGPLSDFKLWQVNHIRWNHEDGERYGQSQLLQIRGYAKKLAMADDDLVVRRRTRAALRRLHVIGTPENPGDEAEIAKYKARNSSAKYGAASVVTDYYSNGTTSIVNLDGDASLGDIADVEYLNDLLFLGAGVPQGLLGAAYKVSHDVLDRQQSELFMDQETVTDVLENGDGGAFSGLRSIMEFALSLAGINPDSVSISLTWAEKSQETKQARLSRVIDARSSQPDPLISRKTALAVIAEDFGIDDLDAELKQLADELAEERQAQQAAQTAVNPVHGSPMPQSRGAQMAGEKFTPDATGAPQMDATDPQDAFGGQVGLYSRHMVHLEHTMAEGVHRYFTSAAQGFLRETGLEMYLGGDRLNPYPPTANPWPLEDAEDDEGEAADDDLDWSDAEPPDTEAAPQAVAALGDQVLTAETARWLERRWRAVVSRHRPGFVQTVSAFRKAAANEGGKEGNRQVGQGVNVVNPETIRLLSDEAGERVKGIDHTTLTKLRHALSTSYKNGARLSGPNGWLEAVIQAIGPGTNGYRSRMIARTELADAYGKANRSAWQDAGVERWTWVATIDNRTCQRCRALNGQTFPIAHDMPPLHPQCRCFGMPVVGP